MPLLSRIASLWTNLFRTGRVERELTEEVRSFVEMTIDKKIASGMSLDEARRQTLLELGGTTQVKEKVRQVRLGHHLETTMQDIRYGVRMLLKKPGFTIAAMIALALGIGANTAMFSLVHALSLNPLPFPNIDRLVMVYESVPSPGLDHISMPGATFLDLQKQNHSFEDIATYRFWGGNLTGGDKPERVEGYFVTVNLLDVLGVKPTLGRGFSPEEGEPGKDDVVIISHSLWINHFGGDHDIIGKTIAVNNVGRVVVGVMPSNYAFPWSAQVWAPLAFTPFTATNRGQHRYWTIARLKPGISITQARAELTTFYNQLGAHYPETNAGHGGDAVFLVDDTVKRIRPALLALMGAVAFVLLIGCANVGNLMLARATGRVKEIALRSALGASRWRIMRQLLTESIILGLAGGILGVLIGIWSINLLKSITPADYVSSIANWNNVGLNLPVLAFTVGISMMAGVLFGLAPALQVSRPDLNEALKESSGKVSAGGARHRLRNILVVSEVALSLVLLIGAGLMMKSFLALIKTDPGLKTENVLTMNLSLPFSKYKDDAMQSAFFQELTRRVEALPGVDSSGVILELPLGGGDDTTNFIVESLPDPPSGEGFIARIESCTPNYFRAMGITIMKGRSFTDQDKADAQLVTIINESMAQQYWPNQDAVGKRMRFGNRSETKPWMTVVGVIRDVKYRLDKFSKSEFYTPYAQNTWNVGTLVVRTKIEPKTLITAIRTEIAAIDKDQPVYGIKTMDEVLSQSAFLQQFSVYLLGIFAALALILAAVGIYGVMSYAVGQRTHEIGIRMALGASSTDVLKMVVGQGLIVALVGVGIGLVGTVVIVKALSSLLFGVSSTDVPTFAAVSALLMGVSLLACYIPARRAIKVDPMVALRYE